MTLVELATTIANMLYSQWMYDMEVMATPWVHWTVLPLFVYLVFFFCKWLVLTTPLWLPIRLMFQRNISIEYPKTKKEGDKS